MSDWQPTAAGPADVGRSLQQALGLHQQGRLAEAEKVYNDVLRVAPRQVDALHLFGLLKFQQGKLVDAEQLIAAALKVAPNEPVLLSNCGRVLEAMGRHQDALARYEKALAAKPDHLDTLFNRGNVLQVLSRPAEAVESYARVLALNSTHVEAQYNTGMALLALNRLEDALASFDRAIALNPAHPTALNNRGNVLAILGRLEDALTSFDRCIEVAPGFPLAHYNRGLAFKNLGRQKEAQESLEKALALNPGYAEARFALCMAQLPALYLDFQDIDRQRAAYRDHLEMLWLTAEKSGGFGALLPGVGASQPFYLAFQGQNDRDLQARYGELVCRIVATKYSDASLPHMPGPEESVRVGIVSGFFRNHSNWKVPIKGWLSAFDRRSFKVFGYHTGFQTDAETSVAAALCDRFVQGPKSLDQWRAEILSDAPHVLFYPELGMDAMCVPLASQRLAAVQCASWGHPVTSGFPTIDYFLSSSLMEPPNGRDHYTERLIELPNLSVFYEPVAVTPVAATRADFGMSPRATIFWCGQALSKYLPQFDEVFPRIAQAVGNCQFMFIESLGGAAVTDLFRRRLQRSFASYGLRADDHCLVLRRLDQAEYLAAAGLCDVVLDSIGWSGCNSTLECLGQDLPVVAMAGPMMRARRSAAILRMMEVTETLAASLDDYVATAVRLAQDEQWRSDIKSRVAANKHKLYRDRDCVAALAEFLDRVTRE